MYVPQTLAYDRFKVFLPLVVSFVVIGGAFQYDDSYYLKWSVFYFFLFAMYYILYMYLNSVLSVHLHSSSPIRNIPFLIDLSLIDL